MTYLEIILLGITRKILFGSGDELPISQVNLILKEAQVQAVFPLVFSAIQDKIIIKNVTDGLNAEQYQSYNDLYLQMAVTNYQNFSEHGELHELMTENGIPYVVLKGLVSAMYYPEPTMRAMGDVDFLVARENMEKAGAILERNGFVKDHGEADEGIHIAYNRLPMSIWEMHRNVNGVPGGVVGEKIQAEIDRTIETAVEVNIDGVVCRVPDKFHHGLIMLLHTASHLTSEGVGLRHLCDWVVFASKLSNDEFKEIFEVKLKDFGLWQFAQALTLLGIRYLGAPEREWAGAAVDDNTLNDLTLERLMEDILRGGNFGKKDANRYREIKYISDRDEHTVSSGGIARQAFKTLNKKVYSDYRIIEKHRILLPVGYVAEGVRYIGLLLSGKRKSSDTKEMLKEAAERKGLYASLELFKG